LLHPFAYRITDRYADANTHNDGNVHIYKYTYGFCYRFANTNPDRYADSYFDPYTNCNPHADEHSLADQRYLPSYR
jgi:hypothetical protein